MLRGLPRPVLILIILGLLALAGMLGGRAVLSVFSGGGDAEGAYAEAKEHIAQGDLRSARIELMNAVKARPRWGEAYMTQAEVALALFDAKNAQIALDRALASGVKQPAIAHLLGQAAWMRGDLDEAAELLSAYDIPQQNRAYALRYLARTELDRGNLDAAKAAFDEAAAMTPKDSNLWTDIGRYRFVVADSKGAIDALDYAVELDNNNVRALEFRGRLVRSQYGLVAALPWFERALQIAPEDIPTLEEYAATLGEAGRYTDMLAQVRRIIAIDPSNSRAIYMQAVIAARAGDYDLAKRVLRKVAPAYLELPAPMLLKAIVEYQTGSYSAATDLLIDLLNMQPRNEGVRVLLARAQQRGADYYNALETIRPVAQREDADSYVQMLTARLFEAIGERDRAAIVLDEAAVPRVREAQVGADRSSLGITAENVARNPGNARAVIPYIRNLLIAGNLDEATNQAEQLVQANPGVADAHMLMGDVEMARGNRVAAIAAYQRVRQISFSQPVMLRLVDAMRKEGQADAAREVLSSYLALNPADVGAMRLMAYDYLDRRQWNAALPLLRHVRLRIGPNDSILLANLARAYSGIGDHAAAKREAVLAYNIDPASPMVTKVYGQVMLAEGRNRKAAIELLEKAQILMPDNAEVAALLKRARALPRKS